MAYVPAIDNYILLPQNEYNLFTVTTPHDAVILPTPLHEGAQRSNFVKDERARGMMSTNSIFIAVPRKGGDCVLISVMDYDTGCKLTGMGFE